MESILCERRTYTKHSITHVHPYCQLVLPIYGALSVSVQQAEAVEKENIIYIPADLPHSFHSSAANQFFVFDVPSYFLPKGMGEEAQSYEVDRRWQAVRSLLLEEVGSEPATNQRLTDLFRYIAGLLEVKASCLSLDYIKSNFHLPISVAELAEMEHFNPTYYVEWFKRRFGTSPISYIRELRLGKAKELLIQTDYSIMQIACQIGYENQATLTRLLRQDTGMTPRQYREKYRK